MGIKPSILVQVRPSLYEILFSAQSDRRLRDLGEVTYYDSETNPSSEQLAALVPGYDVVVTGWGTPPFAEPVLSAADKLRLIAHSAGSIKRLLPPPVFQQGIKVTHGAAAIATAVADMSLTLTMMLLRLVPACDRALRDGDWGSAKTLGMGREIAGTRVGVVGAGYTGRCFIKLLNALDAEVWVYDPYLSDERAQELSVTKVGLDDLFAQCSVVSVQAPSTEETHHMVSARQLSLLQDGACFVNTARSWVIDYDALLAELKTGRFWAALDVFDQEPLPDDSPYRDLDNVVLTPHIAGASVQARHRQGQYMVDEIERFLGGQPMRYEVTERMLETMA